MSAIEKFNPEQQMLQVRDRFVAVAQSKIDFDKEKAFAIQILNNSEYLFAAAQQNPESLMNAVYNVALTGLTLNPVLKFAYLLPRKKKVILEPSYMGLIKILTDAGVVKSIRSYVVRKADLFSYELGTQPYIKHVPSGESGGEIIAAYAIAELTEGGMQFEVMTRQEIDIIMNRSDSVKAGGASPWKTDYSEMARKTVIRRLYKYLPKTQVNNFDALAAVENEEYDEAEIVTEKSASIFSENIQQAEPQQEAKQLPAQVVVQQPIKAEPPKVVQVAQPIPQAAPVQVQQNNDFEAEFKFDALVREWKEKIHATKNIHEFARVSKEVKEATAENDRLRKILATVLNLQMDKLGFERDTQNNTYRIKSAPFPPASMEVKKTPYAPKTTNKPVNQFSF